MRLFFLGTGAAEGIPALFCECGLCEESRRRGGRDLRTRTSVLVGNAVRIDLPPDALVHLHRYPQLPLARLRYLLFTHSHDDHFAVRELQYLSPTFAPERACPLDIWLSTHCRNELMAEAGRFFEKPPTPLHVLEPYQTYRVGPLHVTPIVARHREGELCFNFLFSETPDAPAVLYASDTGWYEEETGSTWRGGHFGRRSWSAETERWRTVIRAT
jgi:phosphoribosyl 1,2-cyclic phosphate phosphodiesterase